MGALPSTPAMLPARGQPLRSEDRRIAYSAGALASVDLVHARFVSALTTPPTTTRILPVETDFRRLTAAHLEQMFGEVMMPPESFARLRDAVGAVLR